MHRTIRRSTCDDIPAIMLVIDAARKMMHASGNVNQWINGYPSEEVIHADIARDGGFLVTGDERLAYQKTISLQDQLFALQDKAY